jgi:predicted nucleic acid-binding protein
MSASAQLQSVESFLDADRLVDAGEQSRMMAGAIKTSAERHRTEQHWTDFIVAGGLVETSRHGI